MKNQTKIDRINGLSDIIHRKRDVMGKDYSDLRSKYGELIVIGHEPACSYKQRRSAKKELKNISKTSLDEEVRKMAKYEVKHSSNFRLDECMRFDRQWSNEFLKAHPIIDICCFMVLYWTMIVGGVALFYYTARLYNYLSK